jgi:sec-independent protein translocase protein TatB
VFDVGLGEVIVLLVVALFIFGPERLPKVAAQAGRGLRDLRSMASAARKEIQDSIGPEFDEFKDIDVRGLRRSLDPQTFVRKQLLDGDPARGRGNGDRQSPAPTPFDADTT